MKVFNCRLCKAPLSEILLKLPDSPLANEFVSEPIKQDLFSLELCSCTNCHHYQLTESVDGERLFRNYSFVSGTSKVNVAHFTKLAEDTVKRFFLKPGDFVVEIASNDGTLLQAFKNLGMRVLGVDPAENIAKIANENGIETLPDFFTSELAKNILLKYGTPKLVIANNIIAHTDYVIDIINGVSGLIKDGGVFIFENSYFKDMYEKTLPDLIYSEHISHYLVYPLSQMFVSCGLHLFDVENIDVHGGSIRGFVSKTNLDQSENLKKLITEELELGLISNDTKKIAMKKFADKIDELGKNLTNRLKQIKNEGKSIAIYGMPAKATTLMYAFNIDPTMIDFAVDDADLKIGTYSPGKHIPVLSPDAIYEKKPDYILILAWNFADSIMKKHLRYSNQGGHFIVPIPELKEHYLMDINELSIRLP
jgi:hypothetical protein